MYAPVLKFWMKQETTCYWLQKRKKIKLRKTRKIKKIEVLHFKNNNNYE